MVITCIQDIRKPSASPQNTLESNSTVTEEEQDEDESEDEDIELYNYISGETYYENDKNFVFPRIKVK